MSTPSPTEPRPALSPVVKATGWVSFFTDMGSEIIYPMLPLYLTQLGASRAMIGCIEGLAEGFPAFIRLVSGALSDRVRNRKWLVLAGYGLSTLFKPLIALARTAGLVLVFRLVDRLGKGVRTAPRDALVADNTDPRIRGYAFGFQRGMDHAGAMLGGLLAFGLLAGLGLTLRQAIGFSVVPGLLALLTIVFFIHDRPGRAPLGPGRPVNPFAGVRRLPPDFFAYAAGASMFAMANSSDAFLLLRARDMGVAAAVIPLLWSLLHLVKSVMSIWGGKLSDRVGRMPVLLSGWMLYAGVYAGFALLSRAWTAWLLFALYGVFFGLTEGASRAVVADLVPEGLRGSAFGLWGMMEGLLLILASVLTGWLWDRTGDATVPLLLCGALSFCAAAYLGVWAALRRRKQRGKTSA